MAKAKWIIAVAPLAQGRRLQPGACAVQPLEGA